MEIHYIQDNVSENRVLSVPELTQEQDTSSVSLFDAENIQIEETETGLKIKTVAHRGYSTVAPENTLPAFYAAAEAGFSTAECDIEWTKDGVPVILHDEYINRTATKANGNPLILPRKCSNMTYESLLKYDFGLKKGKEFKGTKIPTFAEILQCCKETGLNFYVELKDSSKFGEEQAKLLTDMVKEAGLEDKITWISFNSKYLKMIADNIPEARLGYLSRSEVTDKTIKTLESLKTGENEVFLDIKASEMNSKGDNMLDAAGFAFEAWTIDDEDILNKMQSYDCSGITTNTIP